MPDLPVVRDGDLAFAWNIENISDILRGNRGFPVRFTRNSSDTQSSLTLANRTAGGPVMVVLSSDLLTEVMRITDAGFVSFPVAGYFDMKFQTVAPAAPGAGTQKVRVYSRAGGVYFKVEGSGEQQFPIGAPPGPTTRYAWFIGG